jgi:hypothetical protein
MKLELEHSKIKSYDYELQYNTFNGNDMFTLRNGERGS